MASRFARASYCSPFSRSGRPARLVVVSNDQLLNGSLTIFDTGGRVVSRRSGVVRPRGSPGAALDGTGCLRRTALPQGWRVVALVGDRRDTTPPRPAPTAAVLVAGYPRGLPARRGRSLVTAAALLHCVRRRRSLSPAWKALPLRRKCLDLWSGQVRRIAVDQ
jgi:hypothetical protein